MSSLPIPPPPKSGTYLGFDYGSRFIGVAVGQTVTATASGLETIINADPQAKWAAVSRLVQSWQPCGFVVGLAYQEDGSANPINPQILKFCRQLHGRYGLPVYTMDETLSTAESRSLFYQSRVKASVQFDQVKDVMAAQLILQTWLEHTRPLA